MAVEASNILTKGLQSDLTSAPIVDGTLRYTTDTGCLFLDVVDESGSRRVNFSSVISDLTEEQIFSLLAPLDKIYISSDTHRAYISTPTEWIDLAAIKLSVADINDKDRPLWFANPSDEDVAPVYVDGLSYNTATEELKTPNLVASSSIKINGMKITDTLNADGTTHTVEFSFV